MDSSIDTALRAAPGSDASRQLTDWLRELDDDKWRTLLPEIREIAREAAPKAAGVLEPDDVLGELAVLAFERWLPRYRDELSKGTAPSSLRSYLKLRIDRHVAEMRRKQRRRRQLLASAMPVAEAPEAEPILVGRTGEPYSDTVASELMRKAGSDRTLRAVLALKYAGFTQDEIASYLEVSRPTVSRRVATLAAALTVLVAIGLTAWWFTRPEDAPIVTPDGDVVAARPNQGAAPPRPPLPEELTDAQIQRVVSRNHDRVQSCFLSAELDEAALRVDAALTIAPRGHVVRIDLHGYESEPLRQCIRSEITHWRFPRARGVSRGTAPFVYVEDRPTRTDDGAPEATDDGTGSEPDSDASPEQQAAECTARGDNQCVIRTLEGRARSPRAMALLIEAYRAQSRQSAARRHMRTYVRHWPRTPQGRAYQQILTRQGL